MEGAKDEVALCKAGVGLGGRCRLEGSSIMAVKGGAEVLECHVACSMVCGRGGQQAQATQWGDADDGGRREGCMAEEHMGGGGDMDNGGMSKEHVSMWAHGHVAKGTWAVWTMGVDTRSAWMLIEFCTVYIQLKFLTN